MEWLRQEKPIQTAAPTQGRRCRRVLWHRALAGVQCVDSGWTMNDSLHENALVSWSASLKLGGEPTDEL